MNGYERPLVGHVVELLAREKPALVLAVTGPRQTGKTTLVDQALRRTGLPHWLVAVDDPKAHEVQFGRTGDMPDRDWLVNVWDQARQAAWASRSGFVLALDEVQRIENWSGLIKGLWDRDRAEGCPLRVVVLGSAPWEMMTGLNESLTGRFMPVPVRQWSLREMVSAFDFTLDEYLFFGGYPAAAQVRDAPDVWRRYVLGAIVEPTISKDILSLARVDKPALMRQLMELVQDYSGQILAYTKMLGQLTDAGNATTLARYLQLLEHAGLAVALPNHSARSHLRRASPPKLNVLDVAVMTAHLGDSFKAARQDRSLWGRIVESAVGAHLHNTLPPAAKLRYWRRDGHEVDFVLTLGSRVVGIEVKSGKWRAASGLEAFGDRFPGAKTRLVGTGGTPLNEFLGEPAALWLEDDE